MDFDSQDLIDLSKLILNIDYRKKIYEHFLSNTVILRYYDMLYDEFKSKNEKMASCISNKKSRLEQCNSVWESDYYQKFNVKDYKKTYYCKDKFCLNCKKWRQAKRNKKFIPALMRYDKDLYFVTYTVPNVVGLKVKETINRILKAHQELIKYFMEKSNRKSKLMDFRHFNMLGGIRVLEISINRTREKKYHVHLHCAYILKDYEIPNGTSINKFSHDNTGRRNYVRLFTQDEINLQKFWYYLYEGINLKTQAITLDAYYKINKDGKQRICDNKGYSVTIDKFAPGQYQEMFKYIIKDKATYIDENGELSEDLLSYDEFKTLYFATANVHQLYSFGILKDLKDDDIIDDDDIDDVYLPVLEFLNIHDKSKFIEEKLSEVAESDSIYISKKKIYSELKKLVLEEFKSNCENVEINNKLGTLEYKEYQHLINQMVNKDEIKEKYKSNLFKKVVEIQNI